VLQYCSIEVRHGRINKYTLIFECLALLPESVYSNRGLLSVVNKTMVRLIQGE